MPSPSDVRGAWFIMSDATMRQSTQLTSDYFDTEAEAWDDAAKRLAPAEDAGETERGENMGYRRGAFAYDRIGVLGKFLQVLRPL